MKKLLLGTVASFALSLPAMAQNQDMNQNKQPSSQNQVQQQQLQDQNSSSNQQQDQNSLNNQQQAQNTINPSQLDRQQVRQIQQTLNKKGFDAGHVDGRWGAGYGQGGEELPAAEPDACERQARPANAAGLGREHDRAAEWPAERRLAAAADLSDDRPRLQRG